MFSPYVDLHTHTTQSDGRLTPQELIQAAQDAGICVMSITDHNYTEDLGDLRADFPEMTLIQGAEVSALYTDGTGAEHELHIVALGFDPKDPGMQSMLARHQPDRRPYIEMILDKLRENGIDLGTYDDIVARCPNTKYVGRMALARCLFEDGYTTSVDQSFDIYLGVHGERRAYIKNPLRYDSLDNVVRTIIHAGGTPILAHLLMYDLDNGNRSGGKEKNRLVRHFKQLTDRYGSAGGMEVFYTRYNTEDRLYLLGMARKYGLLLSAGSDYHQQEEWETLDHRISCSACCNLLDHLGIQVDYTLQPSALCVLSGFSGVGKGTVCAHLSNGFVNGKPIALIRSVTNRPPRNDGEYYTFVTKEDFAALAEQHQFLEYNDAYIGNGYATPAWEVRSAIESGRPPLLEIDRVGLYRLLTDGKIDPALVRSVFLAAPAAEVARRLCLRGTETESAILRRLETAVLESDHLKLYNAVIVNQNIDQTVADTVKVFEGTAVESSFDIKTFQTEMKEIISALSQRPVDRGQM